MAIFAMAQQLHLCKLSKCLVDFIACLKDLNRTRGIPHGAACIVSGIPYHLGVFSRSWESQVVGLVEKSTQRRHPSAVPFKR